MRTSYEKFWESSVDVCFLFTKRNKTQWDFVQFPLNCLHYRQRSEIERWCKRQQCVYNISLFVYGILSWHQNKDERLGNEEGDSGDTKLMILNSIHVNRFLRFCIVFYSYSRSPLFYYLLTIG